MIHHIGQFNCFCHISGFPKVSYVDEKAVISDGVHIGPFCVVGPGVKLGSNVKLVAQVNLSGTTIIGNDCKLYPFVSMGHPPQDMKHKGGEVSIEIGERCTFRENVNIHPGVDYGKPVTRIGNDCYFISLLISKILFCVFKYLVFLINP